MDAGRSSEGSLAGLFSAVLAIYFPILGIFSAAMIGLIWAVFFDCSDGIVARRMKAWTEKQRIFGGQLDSLIDMAGFGVCPAVVLSSYGEFGPWFVPGAFCIVAARVLRLSYFNVFGLTGEVTYQGLAWSKTVSSLILMFLMAGNSCAPVSFTLIPQLGSRG